VLQIWAYDLNDLAAVKTGTKRPWEVLPYAIWPLAPAGRNWNEAWDLFGVTIDPATKRIFISQKYAGGEQLPLVHVFQVS
jgi:hypothetical protein